MRVRKGIGLVVVIALLVLGGILLARPTVLAPESAARQRALLQLSSVGRKPGGGPSPEFGAPASGVVLPAEVNLAALPQDFVLGPSQYEKWLLGLVDFENEGLRPPAEMEELRQKSLALQPDFNIQAIQTESSLRAPGILLGFPALDSNQCCGGGTSTPPDPELAVGPNHIIAVVNVAFRIYDKSGNSLGAPVTFDQFFSPLGGTNCTAGGPFDPNVAYDEAWDRYILASDGNGNAYCMGVSKTSDPTGEWWLYQFPTNINNLFFDFPHLGVGDKALYMGANLFSGLDFVEGRVWAFDKSAMYNGLQANYVTHSTGDDDTPTPLHLHGYGYGKWPTAMPHFFLATRNYNGSTYQLYSWEDPFSTNSFSSITTLNIAAVHNVAVGLPIDTPQSGGQNIQANDFRPLDFEYQDGFGWTTMTVACNPGGGTVNCIQWAQINLDTRTIRQAGVFASSGVYRIFPDLAANYCGDAAVGYTRSNSSTFPSVYATGRASSDPLGTMQAEILLKAGEVSYRGFDSIPYRWGDYTEMALDPDGITFWYIGEYSKNTGTNTRWGTYISAMQFSSCELPVDFALDVQPRSQQVCLDNTATFNVGVASISGYSQLVTLDLQNFETQSWSFTPNPVLPPSSSLLELQTNGLTAGNYALNIVGFGPTQTHTATVQMDLVNPLMSGPTLASPGNGNMNVGTSPTFSWSSLPNAVTYELQVSRMPDFSTLVYTTTSRSTTQALPITLEQDTLYFWRVRGKNACGDGQFSSTSYFITTLQVCKQANQSIPDNGVAISTLTSSAGGVIQDLDVSLEAAHTFVGDLSFTLKHVSSGTTVTLIDRPGVPATTYGCSGNDINVILDDEGTSPVENACASSVPTISGRLTPQQPLAAFDNKSLAGSWELRAQDHAASDTGSLIRWCLQPTLGPAEIQVFPGIIEETVYPNQPITVSLAITNPGTASLHWFASESVDGCQTITDLPWLSVDTQTGKIQPDTSFGVEVWLDPQDLRSGNSITGQLCILNNSLNTPMAIPITLTAGAELYISPTLTTISVERPFSVTIAITGTIPFTAANLALEYDPVALEVIQVAPGTCLVPNVSQSINIQPLEGRVNYTGKGSSPCPGAGDLVIIQFRGLAPGRTLLTLVSGILTDTLNQPVGPFGLVNGEVELFPKGTLAGSIQAQGQQIRSPDANFQGTIVTAWDGELAPFTSTVSMTGTYSLPLPAGSYTVTIEMPRYLDALTHTIRILPGETTNLPVVLLLGGDANDNDLVNIFDLSIISAQYGATPASPGWDERADINADLVIDIRDIAIAASNYLKTSIADIPWY